MFLGAACSKLAACRATGSDLTTVAFITRKSNTLAAMIMSLISLLALLEGQQIVGESSFTSDESSAGPGGSGGRAEASSSDADTFRAANLAATAVLGISTLLHANLAIRAHLLIAVARREASAPRTDSDLATATVVCVVDDDGSRVRLDAEEVPVDDRTYVMYHGTRPEAADQIERFGFMRSKDGMLGPGVYLSRDIMKAAHYPLDVPYKQQHGRVIFECLVQVGKVKRIDCIGHPMQKTWNILGYDTAWVPPNCGVTPSGLEEDCISDPARIRILRRVKLSIEQVPSSESSSPSRFPGRVSRTRSPAKPMKSADKSPTQSSHSSAAQPAAQQDGGAASTTVDLDA